MKRRALLLFSLFLYSAPSLANEALTFKAPASYKEKLVVKFLNEKLGQEPRAYILAKSDLNNDSIDEYIAKPASRNFCKTTTFCPHHIVALHKYTPLLIGSFDAHEINVSYKDLYGVRHLLLYNNQHNNFTSSAAHWNPFLSKYEIQ